MSRETLLVMGVGTVFVCEHQVTTDWFAVVLADPGEQLCGQGANGIRAVEMPERDVDHGPPSACKEHDCYPKQGAVRVPSRRLRWVRWVRDLQICGATWTALE
jgi:hypothetical protein